jgi:hypothetical protein
LSRETLKTPVYSQLEQILGQDSKDLEKKQRTMDQFKDYFLKENWSFKKINKGKSNEFQK